MIFKVLNETEFNGIREDFDYNFYQSSGWTRIKKTNGWGHEYVAVFEGDRPVLVCNILMRKILNKYLCYAPRGPLIADDVDRNEVYKFFLENVGKFLKKKGGFVFTIDPYIEMRERDRAGDAVGEWNNGEFVEFLKKLGCRHKGFTTGYSKDIQFRWSYGVDVKDKTPEELMADMNYRCKRSIKRAERYPMFIKEVDETNLDDFKGIMEHTASRHEHADRGADYYMRLKSELDGKTRLSIVYLDREAFMKDIESGKYEVREDVMEKIAEDDRPYIPISSGVFILDKKRMNYVYGGTYSYYFPFMAQYKLQMEMIKYSIDQGMEIYDFGGIKGIFDKDHPDYKLYDYKRGYGGHVIEYIGEFDLPIDKAYLFMYEKMFVVYKKLRNLAASIKK